MNTLKVLNAFCHIESTLKSNKYDKIEKHDIMNISSIDDYFNLIVEILNDMFKNGITDVLLICPNQEYSKISVIFCKIIEGFKAYDKVNLYILPEYHLQHCIRMNTLRIEDLYYRVDYHLPRLSEYQVHVIDTCNLKCKGCGHYCSMTTEPNFLDVLKYEADIKQIRKKFWGVGKIYLLGGEPLLSPSLPQLIDSTRRMFPDTDIRVLTNGLLLTKMKTEFWNSVRKNNIHIEISMYKPTLEIEYELYKKLDDENLLNTTILWREKQMFYKGKLLKPNLTPEISFQKCASKMCHFLRDGMLALCPSVCLNDIFCQKFNIPQQFEPDGINLYDENIDGWAINEIFTHPSVACKYCSSEPVLFEWEKSSPELARLEDWVI